MKLLKTLAMGIALSAVTVMPGMAFDLEKDAAEWTANPDCVVTMYLGMPSSEFENNFSDIKGWKKTVFNNFNAYYPCHMTDYRRIETSSFNNKIATEERVGSIIREDTDSLEEANISLAYVKKTKNLNYKKDILPAMQNIKKIKGLIIDNMTKKYGPYTKITNKHIAHAPNGQILGEYEDLEWDVGNEVYYVGYSIGSDPRSDMVGIVTFQHRVK